jgi:hypothetical protein
MIAKPRPGCQCQSCRTRGRRDPDSWAKGVCQIECGRSIMILGGGQPRACLRKATATYPTMHNSHDRQAVMDDNCVKRWTSPWHRQSSIASCAELLVVGTISAAKVTLRRQKSGGLCPEWRGEPLFLGFLQLQPWNSPRPFQSRSESSTSPALESAF